MNIPSELISAITSGNCVAFIGAGFSVPCKLPTWATLLNNIVNKLDNLVKTEAIVPVRESDSNFFDFMRTTITTAQKTFSSDLFDLVGQLLEDHFGTKVIEGLVEAELALPTDMEIPEEMKERLEFLRAVPFKAILTTNFDMLLLGPSPWSSNDEFPYARVLRSELHKDKNASKFSADELIAAHVKEISKEVYGDESKVKSKNDRPIIKLHGSCGTNSADRALVWTRTGYRKLLHQTPGYANFMKSVLATCTVLYLGFSFSDGYLNDIRGEVLSMLYGEGSDSARSPPPIGFAITHDKNKHECDFFERHEGVRFLTWSSHRPDGTRDFSGFDKYLLAIREMTSFQYYIGKITTNKKVLVLEYSAPPKPSDGSGTETAVTAHSRSIPSSKKRINQGKASLGRMGDLVPILESAVETFNGRGSYDDSLNADVSRGNGTVLDVVDSPERAIEMVANVEYTYDAIVTVFGEDRSHGNHWWKVFADGMRKLSSRKQAPFIVYSTEWNCRERRKVCLAHGAYDFVVGFADLVHSLARLLDADSKQPTQDMAEYAYDV